MRERLIHCFQQFDAAVRARQREARAEGVPAPKTPIQLHIVGQTALLLGDLSFPIAGTMDLDALGMLEFAFAQLLNQHLLDIGLTLETDRHLIWMPPRTLYRSLYAGVCVRVDVAEPLYVIASKCKFKRAKDRMLIAQYFAHFPDARDRIAAMHISTAWVDR